LGISQGHQTIDIATVVYGPDVWLLKLQARSLRRFFEQSDAGRIFVLINEDAPESTASRVLREVIPEYGSLAERVKLVSSSELMHPHPGVAGWRSQQSLKLLVSTLVTTPCYLLLDAKNHFIRRVGMANFSDPATNRLRSYKVKEEGYLRPFLLNSLAYFGVAPQDFNLPATTPYVMSTETVRGLLAHVEQKEGMPFDEFLHGVGRNMTEFYLYYAFILKTFGTVQKLYSFGPRNAASLFTMWPRTAEHLENVFARTEDKNTLAFGLHKNRLPQLDPRACSRIALLWANSGLFDSLGESAAFLERLIAETPIEVDALARWHVERSPDPG
jgi:hypothetical protein